ncbi:MAG: hypothetical protein K0R12_858 [Gammaproteobacteria bacterium]|jgi:hypothetical protein|nr:hypothetical protein [Gammaproteobacteria bacterium]
MRVILRTLSKAISIVLVIGLISTAYGAAEPAETKTTTEPSVIQGLNNDTDVLLQDDNSIFNLSGVDLGGYYDSLLGPIAELKVSSYLLDNQHAAAVELNGGPKMFRLNATYGMALTDKQWIKITGEQLNENRDFDFDTGTVSQWVGQQAIGADYAYMLGNTYLESLGFGGYYTHSGSKDLSDVTIPDPMGGNYIEQRRIAGANSGNIHTNVSTRLWSYSRLSGGIDYDTVRFDTKYNNDQDVQGLGAHAALEQRLLPTVKLTLASQLRQTERSYNIGLGWLMPSIQGVQNELQLTTGYSNQIATGDTFYTTGLRLNMDFDADQSGSRNRTYDDLNQGSTQTLLDWTNTPSVRMSEVLAITDSSTVAAFTSCPDPNRLNNPVAITENGKTKYKYTTSDGWTGVSEGNGDVRFEDATYDARSQTEECLYHDTDNLGHPHQLKMTNDYAGAAIGNAWKELGSTELFYCPKSAGATQCRFEKQQ